MRKVVSLMLLSIFFISCKEIKKENDNPVLGEEQVTFMIQNLPQTHNFDNDLFISGDFEGWSGGREQFKFEKADKSYSITIPKYRERISFKLTQGDWAGVECAENGNPIENRTYEFSTLSDTIKLSVKKWHDATQLNKPFTAAKNVKIYAQSFEIPQLHRARKIRVYLPPNYETTQGRFPVLYMHDGQNVFDESTSYSGEWQVDETLNKLYDETGFGLIVVAIDHGGDKRLNEYSPWDNKKYGQGEGKRYVDFLVNTLKPKIDISFRTKLDSENTAIMGSSLGGLISHYATFQYPDVFSKAGLFSPSFWYGEYCFDFTKYQAHKAENSKVYFLAGAKEDENMVENIDKMVAILRENNFAEKNLLVKIVPDGVHSESFWKIEFESAIRWLYNIE